MSRAALVVVLGLVGCTTPPPATPVKPPPPDPDYGAQRDPINTLDFEALHRKTQRITDEIVAHLPGWQHDRVANVELRFDQGEVNAYASCAGLGRPKIAVTDELLQVMARLAAARANEEVFGLDSTRAYADWMAAHQSKGGSLVDPPQDREDPAKRIDRRKLTRQHELFDEGIAWVVGHELAHHYLNHLSCDGSGGIVTEVRDAAQQIIPAFHQPDELAADTAGIASTLAAGRAREHYTWKQEGALLLLEFFAREHAIGVEDVIFAFAMTHPPAQVRIPVLRGAVATWYVTNGVLPPAIPYPSLPLAEN